MTHVPHFDAADFPGSERATNHPNIPSNNTRERPPHLNEQVCACHCHYGTGCYCVQTVADPPHSNSNGHNGGGRMNDVDVIGHGLTEMVIDDSDSDVDLESESSCASFMPRQHYILDSQEYEGMVAPGDYNYEVLQNFDNSMSFAHIIDDVPDDLDEPFTGPRRFQSPSRLATPVSSMEVNLPTNEHSMRSSMMASHVGGSTSQFIRYAGFRFQEQPPLPTSRFLELTPPRSPS